MNIYSEFKETCALCGAEGFIRARDIGKNWIADNFFYCEDVGACQSSLVAQKKKERERNFSLPDLSIPGLIEII
jgi:hypothetical protein